jgi:hypothetical protein
MSSDSDELKSDWAKIVNKGMLCTMFIIGAFFLRGCFRDIANRTVRCPKCEEVIMFDHHGDEWKIK